MRDAFILAERRSISAALGAALAGAIAGLVGGLLLVRSPASDAPFTIVPVFGLLGAISGAIGAAGIAAGVGAAEAIARSRRSAAIIGGAALGGLAIGAIAQVATRWTLRGLFGLELAQIGGPIEGLILGAAAGLGYAATTRRPGGGGMAAPAGSARARTALAVGIAHGRRRFDPLDHRSPDGGRSHQRDRASIGRLAADPDAARRPLQRTVVWRRDEDAAGDIRKRTVWGRLRRRFHAAAAALVRSHGLLTSPSLPAEDFPRRKARILVVSSASW